MASDTALLYQNAVNQATKLVGVDYLWGGKGFDYLTVNYPHLSEGACSRGPLRGTGLQFNLCEG